MNDYEIGNSEKLQKCIPMEVEGRIEY